MTTSTDNKLCINIAAIPAIRRILGNHLRSPIEPWKIIFKDILDIWEMSLTYGTTVCHIDLDLYELAKNPEAVIPESPMFLNKVAFITKYKETKRFPIMFEVLGSGTKIPLDIPAQFMFSPLMNDVIEAMILATKRTSEGTLRRIPVTNVSVNFDGIIPMLEATLPRGIILPGVDTSVHVTETCWVIDYDPHTRHGVGVVGNTFVQLAPPNSIPGAAQSFITLTFGLAQDEIALRAPYVQPKIGVRPLIYATLHQILLQQSKTDADKQMSPREVLELLIHLQIQFSEPKTLRDEILKYNPPSTSVVISQMVDYAVMLKYKK